MKNAALFMLHTKTSAIIASNGYTYSRSMDTEIGIKIKQKTE